MEYTIQDIIDGAVENEPTKVQAAFDGVIGPRVLAALEARKREIAQAMFAPPEDAETNQENNTEVSNDENTEPAAENN